MIKAVIFDLDDTLISEYDFVMSGYRYMSSLLTERLGMESDAIYEKLRELSKTTYSRAFDRLFESCGKSCDPEEMAGYIDAYRNHPAKVSFYPDVLPAIKELRSMGLKLGIISDGEPGRQRNKLRAAKGLNLFDEIVLNDEVGGIECRKPCPRGFEVMASRLGIEPSRMIYVGDNPSKDFHISADLGVATLRIKREKGIYLDREYLDGIRETAAIDSLLDIPKLLSKGFPASQPL